MLEVPSWVPDWTALEAKPMVSWRYFARQNDVTQPDVPSRLEAQLQFNHSFDELLVRGYWNGIVEFCTAPFHEIDLLSLDNDSVFSNVDVRRGVQIWKSWFGAVDAMMLRRGPEFGRDYLLGFTTKKIRSGGFNGKFYRNRTRSETTTPRFMSIYMETTSQLDTYLTMKDIFNIFQEAEEVFQQDSLDLSGDSFIQYVVRKLWKSRGVFDYFVRMVNDMAQNHRRMLFTSEGYLGWGSKCIELGDRIAMAAGVPAPLILRPDDPFTADWFKSEYSCVCSAVVLWPSDIRQLSRERHRTIKLI